MSGEQLISDLQIRNDSKIVLVVVDGLGGLPQQPGGHTELEAAATPNLDALVAANICGLTIPILPGITPGSASGHLALFGYDPLRHAVGRGVLEALGIGLELRPGDIAVRGNFCTVDDRDVVVDRRAGRITTDLNRTLVERLQQIQVNGVDIILETVADYRFVVVFRGEDLGGEVNDTDPHVVGTTPHPPVARAHDSQRTADVATEFIRQARKLIGQEPNANMIILRGFGKLPHVPSMMEAYGLEAAAIAIYPMYQGIARFVGMTVLPAGSSFEQQIKTLEDNWDKFDFFFIHYKTTDSRGEDGDFLAKMRCIEEIDFQIPRILALEPDVIIVTGDHSTPSTLRAHSWHPVPVVLAARTCRPDQALRFGESDCLRGGLAQIEAKYLMPLALAHAGRLVVHD
jgi:2,3-bisphosphoglycerate-independent phosphoglycerate mutase